MVHARRLASDALRRTGIAVTMRRPQPTIYPQNLAVVDGRGGGVLGWPSMAEATRHTRHHISRQPATRARLHPDDEIERRRVVSPQKNRTTGRRTGIATY